MGINYSPKIVTDGLVLCLDAENPLSYPGSGNTWYDLSGNGNHFTIGSSLTFSNNTFLMDNSPDGGGGANRNSSTAIPNSTACTLVFWIKSTDLQSLFWGSDNTNNQGDYFVGAYRVGSKEYYGPTTGPGAKAYYQDLSEKANIYDYFPDGNWHMIEFKNVDLSTWTNQHTFNSYSLYTFANGAVGVIKMYNKILTVAESLQNYLALKGRFGL